MISYKSTTQFYKPIIQKQFYNLMMSLSARALQACVIANADDEEKQCQQAKKEELSVIEG